jgi:hypothetical protein
LESSVRGRVVVLKVGMGGEEMHVAWGRLQFVNCHVLGCRTGRRT